MALRTLLIYDVPDDRLRNKIADLCLDYGLDRIQYSAFLGELRRTHQEELMMKIKKQVGKKPANVQLVSICEKDWANRLEVVVESQQTGE
jgi:CRISPR-associated protein Cas2